MDGMWQIANVSERNFTTDDRWGGLAAVKWTPTNDFTVWPIFNTSRERAA
jgi:catecholate siderophore receptor